MGLITATKGNGPLYHAACNKGEVLAYGITNPGEATGSWCELINDAKEAVFVDKAVAAAPKVSRATVLAEITILKVDAAARLDLSVIPDTQDDKGN